MPELRGILPQVYKESRKSESFAAEVVKREARVKYDRRKSKGNKEKFSKIFPRIFKGWFYYFRKSFP